MFPLPASTTWKDSCGVVQLAVKGVEKPQTNSPLTTALRATTAPGTNRWAPPGLVGRTTLKVIKPLSILSSATVKACSPRYIREAWWHRRCASRAERRESHKHLDS